MTDACVHLVLYSTKRRSMKTIWSIGRGVAKMRSSSEPTIIKGQLYTSDEEHRYENAFLICFYIALYLGQII